VTIAPDARGGALGDAGVATSPDVNSQHWNPAKYAFFYPKKNLLSEWNYRFLYKQDTCKRDSIFNTFKENTRANLNHPDFGCIDSSAISDNFSIALSYTPWLRNLVSDINLAYLVGYKRLDKFQSIAASMRYFSLGDITFMSEYGDPTGQQSPNEFAIDLSYIRLLTENFSGAVSFRYIRSDLTGGQMVNGTETHPGNAYAADFAFFYIKKFQKNLKYKTFTTGLNISNIGTKISYTNEETKDFIPTNMKLGMAYSTEIDWQNAITFTMDINKLLVPTPYNTKDIIYGRNSEIGPIEGIINSFSDAPGGWKEELNEITFSTGIEYCYLQNYFARAGYFHEDVTKGNRKYFTTGIGANLILHKKIFTLDASYLIPAIQNNPLANTLRFSISFTI
jgi:hypothetical protein